VDLLLALKILFFHRSCSKVMEIITVYSLQSIITV
jgi:hypothetical protein